MNNQTLERMRQMRLYGMHDAFKNSLETPLKETLSADEFIRYLVNSEWDDRQNRNITRLTRLAGFRYNASIEGIDYSGERGLDRNQITGWPRSTSSEITKTCSSPAPPEPVRATSPRP